MDILKIYSEAMNYRLENSDLFNYDSPREAFDEVNDDLEIILMYQEHLITLREALVQLHIVKEDGKYKFSGE